MKIGKSVNKYVPQNLGHLFTEKMENFTGQIF